MQHKIMLTLSWRVFLGRGNDIDISNFAHKGWRWIDYGLMSMHSALIVYDATQKLLTLRCRSFSEGGSDIFPGIFANKGSR